MAGQDFEATWTAVANGADDDLPSAYSPSPLAPPPSRSGALWLFVGLLVVGVMLGVSVAVGGEAGQFALAALQTAPVILLAALLQWGVIWRAVGFLAWIVFWLLILGVVLVSLGLTFNGLV